MSNKGRVNMNYESEQLNTSNKGGTTKGRLNSGTEEDLNKRYKREVKQE